VSDLSGNPYYVEPADQGLCAGNTNNGEYVMETNNQGEMLVFNGALARVSAPISLDNVMGLGSIPGSMAGPWSSGGDPSCLYDYSNGGHWIITEIVSASSEAKGGPFAGCFIGLALSCYEGIAVSVSSNPLGSYNVYFLNANWNSSEPGQPYLLNDFAKIATTRDAFILFYDEFPLQGGGLGGGFFNGAQQLAFTKNALELGLPVSSPYFNVAIENMGYFKVPGYPICNPSVGGCWYQVIPAQAPDPSQFDNANGGTAFMMGYLDCIVSCSGSDKIAVLTTQD
jgi:hypothetical protein